jgi:hypothetical protein
MTSLRNVASSAADSAETSVPPSTSRPVVGRSSPPNRCMSVDLPDPDGPTMAM